MQPQVADVITRTGLDALFPSSPDRESGIAAFSAD
jgi:hypothetical protein